MGAAQIFGERHCVEPVRRIIGQLYGFGLRPEWRDGDNGSKDFFPAHSGGPGCAHDDRGPDNPAVANPAGENLPAVFANRVEVARHLSKMLFGSKRPNLSLLLHRITNRERLSKRYKTREKLIEDRSFNRKPAAG